ncbi:MAG: hypothetical protein M4579_002557 [Chaenotheca gracillima]|nr:MAG: hypothetical protein M4579_002557 [Chaenotheca gracillima]
MAEATGGGRSDWRRKLTTSSGSSGGKASPKEAPRPRHASDSRSSRSTILSSKSNPTSPIASKNSTHRADAPSEDSLPHFGTVAGGMRSNLFRSGRERALSNRDEPGKSSRLATADESTGRGTKARGPYEKASREGSGSKHRHRTSSQKQESALPSSDMGSSSESSTDDEDGERGSKRGSVIEKVAQRAKLVLPMKRSKDIGRPDKSKDSQAKVSASSSSLQSSLKGGTHLDLSSSEDDDDSNELDANRYDRVFPASDSPSGGTFSPVRKGSLPPILTSESGTSPYAHATRSVPVSADPAGISRPRTVPPRSTSSDAIYQIQDSSDQKPSNVVRSHKIMEMSPSDLKPAPESPIEHTPNRQPSRGGTMGTGLTSSRHKKPSMNSIREVSHLVAAEAAAEHDIEEQTNGSSPRPPLMSRPSAFRSTSAIKLNSLSNVSAFYAKKSAPIPPPRTERKPATFEPPMPNSETEPKVDLAPPSGMYWSKAPCFGHDHTAFRAHTTTLVGGNIFVFGGCDSKSCFNDLYVFDADCMFWSSPDCTGDVPPPLRAMTATAVGKKIVLFGGGDGPSYYNDVYVLDTLNFRFTKPVIAGTLPSKRRAHTACFYRNGVYIFGGGDGNKALNDVWRLDVSDIFKPTWKLISPPSKTSGARPTARGYHTANMVGSKLIVYGGSDGVECFNDVWIFDVDTLLWKQVDIKHSFRRLSHSATIVGSYLFVIGGHDGADYSSEVLLLNLVTMHWDRRKTYGVPPGGRGYHGAVLHDSRIFVIGGFDGQTAFDDTYLLELAVCSYYSQISHFTIDA